MIQNSYQNLFKLPELKRKIFITLALLFVYRIGIHVPTPGVNGAALSSFFAAAEGTLFSMFNMFSGGALERFSIFALGIMPYISASIILELMTVVVPHLAQLKKAHAKFKDIEMKNGLVGMGIPLHPGAEKFFKEKGIIK